jgi:hypothetical protein
MACIPLPKVALPTLPLPLTIAPTFPTFSFDPELCCKLPIPPVATPPVPLPAGTVNPAVVAIVTTNMAIVQKFINSLAIPCPKE